GGRRAARCERGVRRERKPFVEMHPDEAQRLGAGDGDLVQVSSRRGTIQVRVRVSDGVSPGMVFLPFHWGDLHAPENATNYLTISAIGRVAKQPELKFCAVSVERVAGPVRSGAPSPDAVSAAHAVPAGTNGPLSSPLLRHSVHEPA